MAHVMKSNKTAVGGLTRHFERCKKENGEYQNFNNQEIDLAKSHLNYNLATHQNLPQLEFIKKRISEVYCLQRKDVNIMCNWVVTQPSEISHQEQEKFFKETYKFLENRYGKENIISAYVHLDETTPHLHFAFVPVIFDNKKNKHKVSAKEVVNRADLKTFHNDLTNCMEKSFGRDIGILNGATIDGNKNLEELKKESINKFKDEYQQLQLDLDVLRVEYDTKKAYIRKYDELSDVSVMYPNFVEVKEKGLLKKQEFITVPKEKWEQKHISANEKSYLKDATQNLEKSITRLKNDTSYKNFKILEKKVTLLEAKNTDLSYQNKNLKNTLKNISKEKEKEKAIIIDRINSVLENLPTEQKETFINSWNEQKQLETTQKQYKGFEMDR